MSKEWEVAEWNDYGFFVISSWRIEEEAKKEVNRLFNLNPKNTFTQYGYKKK